MVEIENEYDCREYVGIADTSSPSSSSSVSTSFQERIRVFLRERCENRCFNRMQMCQVNSRTATGSTMNGCHKNMIVELQMKTWDGSMCTEISSCGRIEGRN